MSSRLLKKILKERSQREILRNANEPAGEESEESEIEPKHKNRFEFLDDQSESGSNERTQDESTNGVTAEELAGAKSVETMTQRSSGKKGGKAKKKKKKTKNSKEQIDTILNEMEKNPPEYTNEMDIEKDTEFIGDERNQLKSFIQLDACRHEKYHSCLYLDKSNFDINTELRNKFGKDFVKGPKFVSRRKVHMLKHWLITDPVKINFHVPLKMVFDKNEIRIEKLEEYIKVDRIFRDLMNSHSIQVMNDLLMKYPFHIETLLVISEYFNDNGNYEEANKFIKRAIVILQNIFSLKFNPASLNEMKHVYVNPYLSVNKCFYKTLYMHMRYLDSEACTNTALELAKLLCKVDTTNDVCGILLMIDNLMLKSGQMEFLIYFAFNFVIQNVDTVLPTQLVMPILTRVLDFARQAQRVVGDWSRSDKRECAIKEVEQYTKEKVEWCTKQKVDRGVDTGEADSVTVPNRVDMTSVDTGLKGTHTGPEGNETGLAGNETGLAGNEAGLDRTDTGLDKGINKKGKGPKSPTSLDDFEMRLHFILPNFGFAIPLGFYLKEKTNMNIQRIFDITADDIIDTFSYKECKYLMPHFNIDFICYESKEETTKEETTKESKEEYDGSFCACLFLIRALLCYPSFLPIFLKYNNFSHTKLVRNSIGDITFETIMSKPPFSNPQPFLENRSTIIDTIISCFLEKNNMYYKSEKVIQWVHACSAFLHILYHEDKTAERLEGVRREWMQKQPLLDIERYKHTRVAEFKLLNYILPDFIMEKNLGYSNVPFSFNPSSLYFHLGSNAIIVFFQSLLPWYQVDLYGTHSRPVHFSTLLSSVVEKLKKYFSRRHA